MKNISFGEQGLSQGQNSTGNQPYPSQYPIQNQKPVPYTNFEQYNMQFKNQQYQQQNQLQQPQVQQQQAQQFQGQNIQQHGLLTNSQNQQFYSILSNSYLSQQPEDQVQFMQESKDSTSYQQRANYNPNLKLSQQQQQQQLQQQQQQLQQVEQVQEHHSNNEEKLILEQQQKRQNQLLQQRLQDQQIQGEVHEVEEEEDEEHNLNSHKKFSQIKQGNQQKQDGEGILRREYNEEEQQRQEEVDDEEGDDDDAAAAQEEDDLEEDLENQQEQNEEGEQLADEEEEEEEDQEEMNQCFKCRNFAEEVLMMECQHHLCLNCASNQYKNLLKKQQNDQSQDLIHSIDCENCHQSTPLPEESIKVLLSANNDYDTYNDQYQNQQRAIYQNEQQANNIQQDNFYRQQLLQQQQLSQQQQYMQQYQQQQHLAQQQNIPNRQLQQQQQQFYANQPPQQNNNDQAYSNRQNTFQHQQLPSFSNKQNFNNSAQSSPQQQALSANFLQDNQFHENVKASKNKKKSMEGGNKVSQNLSQNQSMSEKNNDETILYCFTCECQCFSLDEYLKGMHKNHNVNNVSKAYESLQEPIDDLRFKIKTRADLLIQDDARLNKKKKELSEVLDHCKIQIQKSFEEVILALQQKQQELIQSAEECVEDKFNEIDKGISKVHSNLQVLKEFDKNLEEAYYKQERNIQNEIRAFNHYSENKTKILETIQLMDTNLFHTIRDKVQYEFQLDTNTLYSHIDSIKRVKIEIFRLKGLETPDPNRLEHKFYEKQQQDKTKKLLEHIIQQHANATSQARVPTAAHEEDPTTGPSIQIPGSQQQHVTSSSFIHQSNIFASPQSNKQNLYLNSNINQSIADIFNSHKSQAISVVPQNTQPSPSRYIRIKVNGTAETTSSKRFHSPSQNISGNQRKIKLSPSGRDLNTQKSIQLSNSINLHGPSPSFKTFSLTSQSTKQAFSNMLNSPSSIVKKYTPAYEKLSLQNKDYIKQNQSQSNSNSSRANIFEQLENFKKNIEEIRKQGQADENNLNMNNGYTQPTPEEQAMIVAQNRIRQLQEKLSTKYC
ncbi:hypothetical protein TTHERM_01113060 (macronuclear) [Tetrahymena thermophila SB210]|uniref:B-box zinc finger protein n=1 Tax=Tetrahymena thermophila (strain SB210) TaxID=312017 RepID=Q24D46_TETTS|nr:hypothetical protein TTHERM_01113060 [Tetrahymena thermophila SB210]EAS05695.2 hypothetical protein TTHERM_01113060 [Tetrahymena thermophila SB210]|eukprot:XP_001025940.2 hypothetical protein TTHERM_01113060 [Tetrahymena thermophila SB210]